LNQKYEVILGYLTLKQSVDIIVVYGWGLWSRQPEVEEKGASHDFVPDEIVPNGRKSFEFPVSTHNLSAHWLIGYTP
jgi:hypothetical protein